MDIRMDPDALTARSEAREMSLNRVFNFVYGWMTLGLVISGFAAWGVAQAILSESLQAGQAQGIFIVCLIAEFALVITISAAIMKLSPAVMTALFALFSAVNGVTLASVFLAYSASTIQTVFFIAAAMFAGMALVGTLTRRSLAGVGAICGMALWGIIIASLVNIFMHSSSLEIILSYVGVAVFVGLTAWDAQKVRLLVEQQEQLGPVMTRKLGILCALQLYLDFINLFLFLLRLFGNRGRD